MNTPTRVIKMVPMVPSGGTLESVIVATDDGGQLIQKAAGAEVRLREVNGKHSDVHYNVDLKDFEVVTDTPGEVAVFAKVVPRGTGFSIMSIRRDAVFGGLEAER